MYTRKCLSPECSGIIGKSRDYNDYCCLCLSSKGIHIGHLNVQGICGEILSKFSELKILLTTPENNDLHIFWIKWD